MFVFEPNSRVEKTASGIRFYEQDILFSNYVFSGNWTVDICFDYLSSGFGIVLAEDSDDGFRNAKQATLFKLGTNDFRVYRKTVSSRSSDEGSTNILSPGQEMEDIHLTFAIADGHVVVTWHTNDIEGNPQEYRIGQGTLKSEYEKYFIGFYSSPGNTIRKTCFISGIPRNWRVNIANTEGGRISFFLDGFRFENCVNDAELEQDNIELEPGNYYVDFHPKEVNGILDLDCYVFPSDANILDTEENAEDNKKNILREDGSFVVESAGLYSLKFVGTNGEASNVCIKDTPTGSYVTTHDEAEEIGGSMLTINAANILKAEWDGEIHAVPGVNEEETYAIVETTSRTWLLRDLGVELDTIYTYIYDASNGMLTVKDETGKIVVWTVVDLTEEDDGKFHVFRNIRGSIYRLAITDIAGEEMDVLMQKTIKEYVPAVIKGPIIVTKEENGDSLDLSASYREVAESKRRFVWFTNEQEVKLPEDLPPNVSELKLYAASKGATFNVDAENIESFASSYVELDNSLYEQKGIVIDIDSSTRETYRYFILEYLSVSEYSWLFTNYEREVLEGLSEETVLEKTLAKTNGGIFVYGIPEGEKVHWEYLYRVPSAALLTSIDYCVEDYDLLDPSDYEINFDTNTISFGDAIRRKYAYAIVDYLKADSYAVNYVDRISQYEVDISTEEGVVYLNYDMEEDSSVREKIDTKIKPDYDKYIVLRKK